MPMPPSRSGVSQSSSRMHSSIYGSAMAPKPAAAPSARPGSGAAFRAGGQAKPFQAPVSNRTAAEDRIRAQGFGTRTDHPFSASTSMAANPAPVVVAAAGTRRRGDENDRSGNLLSDGTGAVPSSPSVFSQRSKQASMPARYQPSSLMGAAQPPSAPPTPRGQGGQQLMSGMSGVTGEFTITDISDPAGPLSRAAAASAGAPPAHAMPPPPTPPPPTPPPQQPVAPAYTDYTHTVPEEQPVELEAAAYGGAGAFGAYGATPPPTPPPPAPPPAPIDPAEAHLGKGVFAGVRLTRRGDGQMVAVKTYDHKEAREERAVAKHMHNEERLAGKLQHQNIIAPQRVTKADGKTQLEMEYAPGGSLESYLKSLGRPLTEAEAQPLFAQIVDAVVYLHDKGICHRDIKLENVVLDAEGTCRLVDFGAAKEGGADTFLMSMQGTPAYMAPEVAMQKAHKGGPADVWALGVLLYNLISGGAFPFWGRNMEDLRRNIQAQPLKLPAHLSPPCKELLTKLLQKHSAARFTVHDVRKHPFLRDVPALPAGGGAAEAAAWAAAAAHVPSSGPAREAVNAGVSAEAAAAANAYRGELSAARAAAVHRLGQPQQPPQAAAAAPDKKHMQSPSRVAPQYQYASRNPITGGPGAGVGVGSRPGSAAGARPGSAAGARPGTAGSMAAGGSSPRSKLGGLMNGSGVPGTPLSHHRAASAAQLHNRPRPF